jgi:hypothetical protein
MTAAPRAATAAGGGAASLVATGGALVVANAAQTITSIYWTNAPLSLWGLLMFIVLFLWLFYSVVLAAFAYAYSDWSAFAIADEPEQRALCRRHRGRLTLGQTMLAVSAMNSVAAVTQWYATPPDRTPPLIQSIFNSLIVVAAAPASKLLLGDRKRYCSPQPVAAVALVLASVAVSLAPTVAALARGDQHLAGGGGALAWSVYYALSCVPQAVAIVGGQVFQIRAGALRHGASDRSRRFIIARMLFYNQIYVLFFLSAAFWVDLLPWFGSSASLGTFASGAAFSFQCSLLGPRGVNPAMGDPSSCPPLTPAWAAGFLGSYVVLLVAQAALTRDSAVFNTVMLLLSATTVSVFWLIPGVNPNAGATPPWSVLTSLALSLAGVVLFKRWELRTPPEEQFTLRSLAEDLAADEEEEGEGKDGLQELHLGGGDDDDTEDGKRRLLGARLLPLPASRRGSAWTAAGGGGGGDDDEAPYDAESVTPDGTGTPSLQAAAAVAARGVR